MTNLPLPLNPLHDVNARENRFSNKVLQLFNHVGLPTVLDVKAATATTPAEILLYDEIGAFGISAKAFANALASVGEGELTIRLNSPGGDVFDAMNIYNAIRQHKSPVTCVVDGLAASAASLIAMAGNKLKMQENSLLMVHNSHTVVMGDRHAMTSTADILAKVDGALAQIYAERSNSTPADAKAIMDQETWLTATEALASQYCDEIVANPPTTKQLSAKLSMAVSASAPADPMACIDCINDAMGSLTEAMDCLMPDDESTDNTDNTQMKMSAAKEIRLRQLRLLAAQQ